MTAYLKAVVAALSSAVATLVAECADGHITPIRVLVAVGALLASFAAVYFTPNARAAAPVAAPVETVVVPAAITPDAISAAVAAAKATLDGAQMDFDRLVGAIADAAPAPAAPVAVPVAVTEPAAPPA